MGWLILGDGRRVDERQARNDTALGVGGRVVPTGTGGRVSRQGNRLGTGRALLDTEGGPFRSARWSLAAPVP